MHRPNFAFAVFITLMLLATACGGTSDSGSSAQSTTTASHTSTTVATPAAGTHADALCQDAKLHQPGPSPIRS